MNPLNLRLSTLNYLRLSTLNSCCIPTIPLSRDFLAAKNRPKLSEIIIKFKIAQFAVIHVIQLLQILFKLITTYLLSIYVLFTKNIVVEVCRTTLKFVEVP